MECIFQQSEPWWSGLGGGGGGGGGGGAEGESGKEKGVGTKGEGGKDYKHCPTFSSAMSLKVLFFFIVVNNMKCEILSLAYCKTVVVMYCNVMYVVSRDILQKINLSLV